MSGIYWAAIIVPAVLGVLLGTFRWEIYWWLADRFTSVRLGARRLWARARGKRLVWQTATDATGGAQSRLYGKWVEEPGKRRRWSGRGVQPQNLRR